MSGKIGNMRRITQDDPAVAVLIWGGEINKDLLMESDSSAAISLEVAHDSMIATVDVARSRPSAVPPVLTDIQELLASEASDSRNRRGQDRGGFSADRVRGGGPAQLSSSAGGRAPPDATRQTQFQLPYRRTVSRGGGDRSRPYRQGAGSSTRVRIEYTSRRSVKAGTQ